jgi:D-xylose transport system substrate-binding protein
MERWAKDEAIINRYAKDAGAAVISLCANENPELQNEQAENLIVQGVDVLVVIPYDADASAEMIRMAHDAGIKVLAYDRMIRNGDLDCYISFDNRRVGQYQAEGVLAALDASRTNRIVYLGGSPLDNNSFELRKGAFDILQEAQAEGYVEVVADTFIDYWSAQEAYLYMKSLLADAMSVDGVVAANDALASGAINALREWKPDTVIPVSGQDAELAACRRVVNGWQAVTVYKPLDDLGRVAVDAAIKMARGEPLEYNAKLFNGFKDVPSILLESVPVTQENMDETVIADGFHQRSAVYADATIENDGGR